SDGLPVRRYPRGVQTRHRHHLGRRGAGHRRAGAVLELASGRDRQRRAGAGRRHGTGALAPGVHAAYGAGDRDRDEAGRGAADHRPDDHTRGDRPALRDDARADGGAGLRPRRRGRGGRTVRLAAIRYAVRPVDRGRRTCPFSRQPAALPFAAHHREPDMTTTHPELTRNQSLVLGALTRAEGPLSAYTILDKLRDDGFRAPLQVYRALEKLLDAG